MNFFLNKTLKSSDINFLLISFYVVINLSFILAKGFIDNEELSDKIFLISSVLLFELIYLSLINNLLKVRIKSIIDYLMIIPTILVLYIVWSNEVIYSYLSILFFFVFNLTLAYLFLFFFNSYFLNLYHFSKKNLELKFQALCIFVALNGLFFQPNFLTLKYFFVVFLLSILLISYKFLVYKNRKILDILISLIIFFIFFKIFLLSSDKDEFHYSWYLGSINSLNNDYQLLQDVVSQYGYLNIYFTHLLSKLFNISSSYMLVLIIILFFTIFYLVFHKSLVKNLNLPISIITFFSVSVIFANLGFAELKGSMFIPSSSVFRFLPAVLTILIFSNIFFSDNLKKINLYLYFSLIFLVSILWSFESAFFTLFSLGSFLFFNFFYDLNHKKNYFSLISLSIKNNFKLTIIIIVIFFFTYLFILLSSKNLLFFYEYALNTNAALSKEIQNNKTTLFYLYLLFLSFIILRDTYSIRDKFLYNILYFSLFVAFSSYFLVRSVDNNIFNILPFLILMIVLMKTNSSRISFLKKYSLGSIVFLSILSTFLSINIYKQKFFTNLFNSKIIVVPEYLDKNYLPNLEILESIEIYKDLPMTIISGKTIHELNNNLRSNGYGLPILPLEQFNILNQDRKNELLNSYLNINNKHLILCTFDCKFYRSYTEQNINNKIFIGNNIVKKVKEISTDNKLEILYLLSKS